jgi:hypothetical protein
MSTVGAAPWLNQNVHKRTIRAPINPLDKSTIVSIFPKPIREVKHTIQPGVFVIEPGTFDNPAVLVVGPSSWWRELDDEQPLLEIPVSSIQIADSVVKDYANGLLASNMADCMPGLFYLTGEKTSEQVLKDHKVQLARALVCQRTWYKALVDIGDQLWARSNGNPLTISDDMRLAARELNLNEKSWLADFTMMTLVNCKFCGTLLKPGFPVCASCHHVVDEIAYKTMNPVIAKEK